MGRDLSTHFKKGTTNYIKRRNCYDYKANRYKHIQENPQLNVHKIMPTLILLAKCVWLWELCTVYSRERDN